MDAETEKFISIEIQNTITDNQNTMMTEMRNLISSEMGKLQKHNKMLADKQISKIEESLTDSYKFKKRGNEEQFKHNNKVFSKLKEADDHLAVDMGELSEQNILDCREVLSQGMSILQQRQKLIKLADSSEAGWLVVHEYESNPLAENSDDEKQIFKAQTRAERKLKEENKKRKESRRFTPYTAYKRPFAEKPAAAGSSSTKPGRCFGCGEKGHRKNECPKEQTNNKISDIFNLSHLHFEKSLSQNNVLDMNQSTVRYVSDQAREQSPEQVNSQGFESPVGSLRESIDEWVKIGTSEFILRVIKEGYMLPFKNEPQKVILKNNKSALDDELFVSEEIDKLIKKGCVVEVYDEPHVVNPLTVAKNKAGKLRLVLDCRHINIYLFQFKFKYENFEVAKVLFDRGDFLISFDLKSAYHHITIDKRFQTYLGFQWKGKIITFTVLPFGLATAGFIFSKVTRELVKYWRSKGHKIIMYLDEGIAGARSHDETLDLIQIIQNDLKKFGFIIAEEKSHWLPTQEITWLGLCWNMHDGSLHLSEEKMSKLLSSVELILSHLSNGDRAVAVRTLAGVVGQLISAQPVFGHLARLHTRRSYECIQDRLSWKGRVYITSQCETELRFWLKNSFELNVRGSNFSHLTVKTVTDLKLFCDASGTGYGGYLMTPEGDYVPGSTVYGNWEISEVEKSSTWRELEAVRKVLFSNLNMVQGQSLQVISDNKNVKHILEVGSKKAKLNDICLDIVNKCDSNDITLSSMWIARHENIEADRLSRLGDCDDWGVQWCAFNKLDFIWGPHTYDRFASFYNRKR
ncbi:hypothetical protein FSP39_013730 [Pinctada imbricata]|uniref:Reverse transcriptase n=1 Tax=Pinctada imbricata TaxID=66713 RepID=A0AA89CA09_PINIB|nr:hypothetical protein FSP39_013730 [Pinctada imbricata]